MAMSPAKLEEHARTAVAVLYSPSSPAAQRNTANEWLVGLAEEPVAWEVGLALVGGGAATSAGNEGFFGASMLHAKLGRGNHAGGSALSATQCAVMMATLLPRYGEALAAASAVASAARAAGTVSTDAAAAPRALANELRAVCTLLVLRLPGRAAELLTMPTFGALPPLALLSLLRSVAIAADEEVKRASGAEAPATAVAAAEARIAADAAAVLPALQDLVGQALAAAAAALSGGGAVATVVTPTGPGAPDLADDAVGVATQALLAMGGWCALPATGASLGAIVALPYFGALRQLAVGGRQHGVLTAAALGLLAAAAATEAALEARREAEAQSRSEEAAFAAEIGQVSLPSADAVQVVVASPGGGGCAALTAHTAEAEAAEVAALQVLLEAASMAAADTAVAAAAGVVQSGLVPSLPELDAELCLAAFGGALLSRRAVALRLLQRGAAVLGPAVRAACWLTRHPRLAVAECFLSSQPWDPLLHVAGGLCVDDAGVTADAGASPGPVLPGPTTLASYVADAVLARAMYPFAPTVLVALASAPSDEEDEDEDEEAEAGGGVLGRAWDDSEERAAPWALGGGYVVERPEWQRFRDVYARDLLEACAAAGEGATGIMGAADGAGAAELRRAVFSPLIIAGIS